MSSILPKKYNPAWAICSGVAAIRWAGQISARSLNVCRRVSKFRMCGLTGFVQGKAWFSSRTTAEAVADVECPGVSVFTGDSITNRLDGGVEAAVASRFALITAAETELDAIDDEGGWVRGCDGKNGELLKFVEAASCWMFSKIVADKIYTNLKNYPLFIQTSVNVPYSYCCLQNSK